MISIKNQTGKNKQNFHLFTQQSWLVSKTGFEEIERFFSAKKNEFFINFREGIVDFLIGVGDEEDLENYHFLEIGQKFSNQFKEKLISAPSSVFGEICTNQFECFIQGLFLGTYNYPFDKEHPFWKPGFEIHFDKIGDSEGKELAVATEAICYGQFAGMEWLNKPANQKTAEKLSFFLAEESHRLKIKYKVLNRSECRNEGLGAYLAVNSASAQEAAFTILEYDCGKKDATTIGLVGKCVLFDSGGISIKDAQNMHYMKSDMGGAAAVMGALFAAAKLKMQLNIIAVLPITDNVISATSYLPSDVVRAANGKTIEVLNTDAEGRLTLADGLAYLTKNYKTDILIDMATLTGSAVRMFGTNCCAYFSNNQNLKNQFEEASKKSGQLIWNLPLWNQWLDDIKSDVADLKNISLKPYSDCIIAAKFLEQFIGNHPNWVHFDIAGVAFGEVAYAKEKAATGYGVRLLVNFLRNYE